MKKIVLQAVLLSCIAVNQATAQGFLNKIKAKATEMQENLEAQSSGLVIAKEEKDDAKKITSYSVSNGSRVNTLDITENDKLISKVGNKITYFREGKDQFIFKFITISSGDKAETIVKKVITKDQFAKCVHINPYEKNLQVKLYLNKKTTFKVYNDNNGTAIDYSTLNIEFLCSTYSEANKVISSMLGKEIKAEEKNTFMYFTGDKTLYKTAVGPHWAYNDGALYLESVDDKKMIKVTYFENNEASGGETASYTLKVTEIPSSKIGDYKNIKLDKSETNLPLSSSVTKMIYKDQEAMSPETINNYFRMTSNGYGEVLTNEYCEVVIKQLPSSVKEKFRKEVWTPRIEAIKAEERMAELARQSNSDEGSSSSSSSSKSSSNSSKAKVKEINFTVENTGGDVLYIKCENITNGSATNSINPGRIVSFKGLPGAKILNKKTGAALVVISEDTKPSTRFKL
jgi:hypothetical protein